MDDLDLARRLRRLRRTVDMLQSDLRREHLDPRLLAQIEEQMERDLVGEPRCAALRTLVDDLRESTLTPRPELYADAVKACERLKDAIEGVASVLI